MPTARAPNNPLMEISLKLSPDIKTYGIEVVALMILPIESARRANQTLTIHKSFIEFSEELCSLLAS